MIATIEMQLVKLFDILIFDTLSLKLQKNEQTITPAKIIWKVNNIQEQ